VVPGLTLVVARLLIAVLLLAVSVGLLVFTLRIGVEPRAATRVARRRATSPRSSRNVGTPYRRPGRKEPPPPPADMGPPKRVRC
jgi:hypothetical protein